MREQIDNNGSKSQANSELIDKPKDVLKELFEQNSWEVSSLNKSGSKYQIDTKNKFNGKELKLNVFFGKLRDEDKRPTHRKIQLGNVNDPRINEPGRINIILGIYCRNSSDSLKDLTFAGFSIDSNTNYTSNGSIRGVTTDFIQEAKVNGFVKVTNLISVFRSEFIFYYIENLQTIHNSSENDITSTLHSNSQDVNNVIYYGSPGTGKSHTADLITNGKAVQKVTFHPDYDYNSFVGGYKPTMDGDKIAYKFVPQIFTKIYIDAWKNLVSADETQSFYLQIEEINRGNCAEIFGDLFQLLDRKSDGSSKYEVTAEEELRKHLVGEDGFNSNQHEGIKDGKLRFPSNLKIIATMNTSDQSLFPMDSAFKRRWDWLYVPINYNCSFSDFTIKLNNGKLFDWLSFLKIINEEIFEITKSQDKQIGNWFIDAQNSGKVISESTFVNKVVFYLWNDVFKDEENTIFKSAEGKNLTYTSFFENEASNNLVTYILEERLKLTDRNKEETTTTGEE